MSYRSFEEVWQDIKKLQDKDVFTLRQRHKNHIEKVDEIGLKTRPDGSKYPHFVTKGAFRTVWKKLNKDGEFVPVEDGGYYFVCACLEHLLPEEVKHSYEDGILHLYLTQ